MLPDAAGIVVPFGVLTEIQLMPEGFVPLITGVPTWNFSGVVDVVDKDGHVRGSAPTLFAPPTW